MDKVKQSIIIIIIGIVFAGSGVLIMIRNNNKIKTLDGVTKAIRIENNCEEEQDEDGDKVQCKPVYTYEVDGHTYQCKSETSGSQTPTATQNKVHYDTKDPEKCMTDYDQSTGWLLYVVIAVGILLVVLGIFNFFKKEQPNG